jgi:hypothetical protein
MPNNTPDPRTMLLDPHLTEFYIYFAGFASVYRWPLIFLVVIIALSVVYFEQVLVFLTASRFSSLSFGRLTFFGYNRRPV